MKIKVIITDVDEDEPIEIFVIKEPKPKIAKNIKDSNIQWDVGSYEHPLITVDIHPSYPPKI